MKASPQPGYPRRRAALPERLVFERVAEHARSALKERAYSGAWTAGSSLSTAAAVAEALDALAQPAASRSAVSSPLGISLTSREIDVLRLLVMGQTDREIATSLFISPRTAQGHVARLFDKLGVSTRTGAVAIALQDNLLPSLPSPEEI